MKEMRVKKIAGMMVAVSVVAGCNLIGGMNGEGGQVACTLEAKICPDGSSVGRTGPNCEFAPCPDEKVNQQAGPVTARFEIYTNGTKRDFSLPMYLNQSTEVYIEASDPSLIHVTRSGITWGEFFETLPFSLTEECLVTGLGEKLCASNGHSLKFVLNGEEGFGVLEKPIEEGDRLRVEYE
jgi:hypothetical protein